MMVPSPSSIIEIDEATLRENLRSIADVMAPARACFVIKGDAYGHGVETVVPVAEDLGIRDFAVFSSHEAMHALQASDGQSRIQIMGHMDADDFPWAAANGMEPWINDLDDWQKCREALAPDERLRIHLEIETGMKRTGLVPENAMTVAREAAGDERFEVVGICTHLAGAEDSRNRDRIDEQLAVFSKVCDDLEAEGLGITVRHVCSSSAALLFPDWRMEMVRVGIAAYGLWPTVEVRQRYLARKKKVRLHLRPVMTWKTCIMATQDVKEGDFIGYGKSYCSPRDTRVAIIPVGYGDGFSRGLSNAGHVLVGGKRCPIVGNVNMNMVQVDVGHLDDVKVGDEVVLIGEQGDEEISVRSFAEAQTVVNYELMVRLSQDVPRVLV